MSSRRRIERASFAAVLAALALVACTSSNVEHGRTPEVTVLTTPTAPASTPAVSATALSGLTPLEAAAAIRTKVTGARPILLLNGVPDEWRARLTASDDSFSVRYTSPDGAQSIELSIVIANPPPPGAVSVQSSPNFHGDVHSLYQTADCNDPTSMRFLLWMETGTWATTSTLGGVPYYLVGTGMTDEEFWKMANSLHPNQI